MNQNVSLFSLSRKQILKNPKFEVFVYCREAYDLKQVLLGYNLFQAVFNAWLVAKVGSTIVNKGV